MIVFITAVCVSPPPYDRVCVPLVHDYVCVPLQMLRAGGRAEYGAKKDSFQITISRKFESIRQVVFIVLGDRSIVMFISVVNLCLHVF